MHRVAVTGIGVICALGRTAEEFGRSLREGRRGIGPIRSADCSTLRFRNGAEVPAYDHHPYFDDKRADFMDRFAQFAVIARARSRGGCRRRMDAATCARATAIITGSCVGGQSTEDAGFRQRLQAGAEPRASVDHSQDHGQRRRQPYLHGVRHHRAQLSPFPPRAPRHPTPSGRRSGWCGPAWRPMAITGGSEAPFSFGILKAWEALRVVSPDTCRPFSKDRTRNGAGRRRRHAGARAAGGGAGPRRAHSCGDCRLRHVVGRLPHHAAFGRRSGPRHARRAV